MSTWSSPSGQVGPILPTTFISFSGFAGDATLVPGSANQLYVVQGIDIVSAGGALTAEIAAGFNSSGADFFYFLVTTMNIEYASWRGQVVIDETEGLNFRTAVFPFDLAVWGYITAAPLVT